MTVYLKEWSEDYHRYYPFMLSLDGWDVRYFGFKGEGASGPSALRRVEWNIKLPNCLGLLLVPPEYYK